MLMIIGDEKEVGKDKKHQKNSNNPKIIEKLLLGLIGSSIYVCSCKKMRYSVKTPLPNKRHKQTNKQWGRSLSAQILSHFTAPLLKSLRSKRTSLFTIELEQITTKMASTAKNTSNNKRSYASAVVGVDERSHFAELTVCRLQAPKNLAHSRIPNTKEEFSFFVDRKSTNATEEQIILAVNISCIEGVNIRDDLCVIEFVCNSSTAVETAINAVFKVDGKQDFVAILPRHKTNKSILIKIANVPFGGEARMKELLKNHWTQYGQVLDLAPHMFPGKPWLTKRWDVLLQLAEGQKKLSAPPVFVLDSFMDTLVCSWPGSNKACLRCKCAGHSTSSCPAKNPKIKKVGALANPHQKIGDARQDKNRTAEVTPTSSSGIATATTSSATTATSATVAQPSLAIPATPAPATLPEVEFTVAIPATLVPPITAATSEAGGAFSFGQVDTRGKGPEVQRIHTPPPLSQPDPDTPKKGTKRAAKAETWTPTLQKISGFVEVH